MIATASEGVPVGLRNALESGNCVLFLGAGIGSCARDKDEKPGPSRAELAVELATHFGISLDENVTPDLGKIAEVVELRKGRPELQAFLSQRLADLKPDEHLLWLFSLTWRAIFTTNYDRLIQRAYEAQPSPTQTPITISASADFTSHDPRFEVPVFHLHGSLFEGAPPFALITETDYARFREKRRMLFEALKTWAAALPLLYIGYSHQDPNWRMVLAELREEFQPATPPTAYRVAPDTPALDREILSAQQIHTIDADLQSFSELVLAALGELHVEPHRLTELEEKIPVDLLDAFRQNPAPVARLLSSWHYVNQEDFNATPNIQEFLDGNHANWSLIAQDHHFRRDVDDFIFDELLDFATSTDPGVRVVRLLAPAGYGVSTELMSLAVSLVKEKAGLVFFHRAGTPILESDIEFATTLQTGPRFFVVDNAADAGIVLAKTETRLKEMARSACLLLGERLNEWRQARIRVPGPEFEIEPLSDLEIDRLLECLERHGALGVLTDLEPSLRRAVIKEKHRKELLVAMREATEGTSFGAIIEDEYRGIASEHQQRLYAAVCGFYRLRALVRDGVLARILDCDLSGLYEEKEAVEGVVYWEQLDEELGIYAARARHHVIAEMVWQRCLDPAERQEYLLRGLEGLNLTFHPDVQAFDQMIRSDDSLSEIGDLEAKVEFFEKACKKDPQSPYVRQHYARMLRREGTLELALSQIKQAIELAPDTRVLHHTLGVILHDMAIAADSIEIGRRRMHQSEQAFRKVIQMNPRDEYGYQGVAGLYLDWAKRAPTDEESADYIRRSEEAISVGLRRVSDKESLWIVSAEVSKWIGDHPQAMKALQAAAEAAPEGGVGRYLLARHYLESGRPDLAMETLRPVIESSPEDYRACLVYASALYRQGGKLSEPIAILRQGELYGNRDARYVATLGGMLFMNGDFSEANEVFVEGRRRSFSFADRTRVHFAPLDERDESVILAGHVATVMRSYCFIRATGFPDFFCPGSKYGSVVMRVGLRVRFRVAFTAQGPVALDPEEMVANTTAG